MAKTPNQMSWLQTNTVRAARIHFAFIFIYTAMVIAYNCWKLIPPQALIQRWTVAVMMLVTTTVVWFLARNTALSGKLYRSLLAILILMDILVAGYSVYTGRGMASRGVALFAIPIIISAIYLSRTALFATASLCVAAYTYAAVRYFGEHSSEGYQV